MAAKKRWVWFKFKVDAHENPKVEALEDGTFRLWTRILALARRSPVPGTVFVTPGIGIQPNLLAAGARCRHPERGAQMLAEIVAAGLIHVDGNGVITVHDFDEHNYMAPSETPAGEASRKRGQRSKKKEENAGPGNVPAVSQPCPETEVEEEVEKEEDPEAVVAVRVSQRGSGGEHTQNGGDPKLEAVVERWRKEFEGALADEGVKYTGPPEDRARFRKAIKRLDADEVCTRIGHYWRTPYCAQRASVALFLAQLDQLAFAPPSAPD